MKLSASFNDMPSHKQKNRLHLAKTTTFYSFTSSIICDLCFSLLTLCIIMTDYVKCSECTCCDHSCVPMLLKSLNCAHLQLKSDLKVAMSECVEQTDHLSKLNAKILHLFKTLKQNESHAVVKVHCVASELGDNNDDITDDKTPSEASDLNSLLSVMTSIFFKDSGPSSQTAEAFSHSWVSYSSVFMCFLKCHILFT